MRKTRKAKERTVSPKEAEKAKRYYRSIGADPLRDRIVGEIRAAKLSFTYVSNKTGVSVSCLRAWEKQKTRRPQGMTMSFALRPLGLELGIVRRRD